MFLHSTTMASASPCGTSFEASQTIWMCARKVSGCWAPSQMSLIYRDSRNAVGAGEELDKAVRMCTCSDGKQTTHNAPGLCTAASYIYVIMGPSSPLFKLLSRYPLLCRVKCP